MAPDDFGERRLLVGSVNDGDQLRRRARQPHDMEFVKLGRGRAFRITRTHGLLGSEFKAGSEAKLVVGI